MARWIEGLGGLINLDQIAHITPNEIADGHWTLEAFTGAHRVRVGEWDEKQPMIDLYNELKSELLQPPDPPAVDGLLRRVGIGGSPLAELEWEQVGSGSISLPDARDGLGGRVHGQTPGDDKPSRMRRRSADEASAAVAASPPDGVLLTPTQFVP